MCLLLLFHIASSAPDVPRQEPTAAGLMPFILAGLLHCWVELVGIDVRVIAPCFLESDQIIVWSVMSFLGR